MSVNKTFLLGIDIGTSGAKAGLFSLEGKMIGLAQKEYFFGHTTPGWSELDPEEAWSKVVLCVKQVMGETEIPPKQIAGIGLSVLGETSMPLDESGNSLYPAIESMDRRAHSYERSMAWFDDEIGANEIFKKTSYPLSPFPPIHKLLWIKENLPDVYAKINKYTTFQDFIVWRLTGTPALDYSMASRTMLYDIKEKKWISEYIEQLGVSPDFFSPVFAATKKVGELTHKAASEMTLLEGIPVVPGAHDQSCAALGVGVVREGVASDGTGSVEAIATATKTPIASQEMLNKGIGSQCHISDDLFLALGFHLAAGSLVRWYRDVLGKWEQEIGISESKDPFDVITEAAALSPVGANGLLVFPHWSGAGTSRVPALNPSSSGAILGLTLGHTKGDLDRAVFEGITFETRYIMESLEKNGIPIEELAVTGGGAKSDFWLQLKADITGKRIIVPAVTEASLLGAALLAGVGVGEYESLDDAVSQACTISSTFEPDMAKNAAYDKLFLVYEELYDVLLETSTKLKNFVDSA